MIDTIYSEALANRLKAWWSPPPTRSLFDAMRKPHVVPESPVDVDATDKSVRMLFAATFFASLRAEEGRYLGQSVVVVPNVDVLRQPKVDWDLVSLEKEIVCDPIALAKLAPALGQERYAVLRIVDDTLWIVAIGRPRDERNFFSQDVFPRIRSCGPGDLVFLRGSRPVFRYRAGEVVSQEHDFFISTGEPAASMEATTHSAFAHRNGNIDDQDRSAIRRGLADLVESIAGERHGGMIAIMALNDPDKQFLLEACNYKIKPLDIGDLIVNNFEGMCHVAQIEGESVVPDPDAGYVQRRLTPDELSLQLDLKTSTEQWEVAKRTLAGMASVDGALLMTRDLRVLGFGCKLPREMATLLSIVTPASGAAFREFDLQKRGTRHMSAAHFVNRHSGRLAITISADGPVGCFVGAPERDALAYWPIHVGAFAPNRW